MKAGDQTLKWQCCSRHARVHARSTIVGHAIFREQAQAGSWRTFCTSRAKQLVPSKVAPALTIGERQVVGGPVAHHKSGSIDVVHCDGHIPATVPSGG